MSPQADPAINPLQNAVERASRPRRHHLSALAWSVTLLAGCAGIAPAPLPPRVAPSTPAIAQRAPPAAAERWRGLIGEYAHDRDHLIILEIDGRLEARFGESTNLRLAPTQDAGVYRIRRSAQAAETLVFERGTAGRAQALRLGGMLYLRVMQGPQDGSAFHIVPLHPIEELRTAALAARPPAEPGEFRPADLVELTALDPTIRLDIRYASTNNFLGVPLYTQARAFLQRPAAQALMRANHGLAAQGYGVLVHDGYRPWFVTRMFWDATPDDKKIFVADPARGSRHNRGCAVDLTLYELASGQPVEMVGGYDEMSARSYPDYPGGTARQRWHRDLLRRAMEAQGFTVYTAEWWHFDYADWQHYAIGTAAFETLGR